MACFQAVNVPPTRPPAGGCVGMMQEAFPRNDCHNARPSALSLSSGMAPLHGDIRRSLWVGPQTGYARGGVPLLVDHANRLENLHGAGMRNNLGSVMCENQV